MLIEPTHELFVQVEAIDVEYAQSFPFVISMVREPRTPWFWLMTQLDPLPELILVPALMPWPVIQLPVATVPLVTELIVSAVPLIDALTTAFPPHATSFMMKAYMPVPKPIV